MTDMELLQYIGEVDDKYILESRKRPKKRKWDIPMTLAACAMLAVLGGTGVLVMRDRAYRAEHAQEIAEQTPEVPAPETSEPVSAQEPKDVSGYGVTLLAEAEYPESVSYEDFEGNSAVWTENQVTEDTHYALKAFAYSTAAKVLANDTQSGCYSPLSLYQALSMLSSGAEGQTQAEILSLLGQPDPETAQTEAGKLYRVNHADNEVDILKIANSLWLDETAVDGTKIAYNEDWVLEAAANYYADVYQTEFSDPAAGGALGAWIAEKTGGFLRPTAGELNIPEETVLAMVNTLWYRAHWAEEFDPARTEPETFTPETGEAITADFMHRTDSMGSCVRGEGYTKADLRLSRGRMTLVLPDEGVAVDDLLTEEQLWDIFENSDYESAEVRWSVPKFETDATYDLEESLKSLGISDAFDRNAANFGRISDTPLVLTKVQQGTHIAVDEEGVEAAAYTLEDMEMAAAPDEDPEIIEMNLNRPFLYLITANDGSPLFLGVVRNLPEIG